MSIPKQRNMASIMIENLFKKTFQAVDRSKSLVEHFRDQRIDWMQACGGKWALLNGKS